MQNVGVHILKLLRTYLNGFTGCGFESHSWQEFFHFCIFRFPSVPRSWTEKIQIKSSMTVI